MVQTEIFRLGRTRCYLLMLLEQARWLAWLLLGIVAVLTTAGFTYSPAVGIATLGFDAFLITMALSFVILACGFNSITGVNMSHHSLSVDGGVVTVRFEDGKEIRIAGELIRPYKIYPGGVVVPVSGDRPGWLWVPTGAFERPEDMRLFLKSLYVKESTI